MSASNDLTIQNGAAWAAIIAAGVGCLAFGVIIDLAEASKACSGLMDFYDPVGNLSGKSTLAVAAWLTAWICFHLQWRNKKIENTGRLLVISMLLVALGIVASCPAFFDLFAVR